MTPELIGLIGVVIGGLLGGGAQILAGTIQERRRHQQWVRDQRAAIYQGFLTLAEKKLHHLADYFDFHSYEPGPPEDYMVALFDQVEDVGIFGSSDAHGRAQAAAEALMKLWQSSQADSTARYCEARDALRAFRSTARVDLLGGCRRC